MIRTKAATREYRDGFDRVFGKKEEVCEERKGKEHLDECYDCQHFTNLFYDCSHCEYFEGDE